MILLLRVKMRSEVVDTGREDRDLDGRAPDVIVVESVLLNDFCSINRHLFFRLHKSLRYEGSRPYVLTNSRLS